MITLTELMMKVMMKNNCINYTVRKKNLNCIFVQNIEKYNPAPKTQNFKKINFFELQRFLLSDIL